MRNVQANTNNLSKHDSAVYDIVCVLYGIDYIDVFFRYSLITLFYPGNLEVLKNRSNFYLFTKKNDVSYFSKYESYSKLAEYTNVIIEEIDSFCDIKNKYLTMSVCHKIAIQNAIANKTKLIFINPDLIYSNNCFSRIIFSNVHQKKALYILSVRLNLIPQLLDALFNRYPISLSPKDLVEFAFNNFHDITLSLFLSEKINRWPSHIYWKYNKSSFIAKGVHLHPVFFDPSSLRSTYKFDTIDGSLIEHVDLEQSDLDFVLDSDEMCIFELSKPAKFYIKSYFSKIPGFFINFIYFNYWLSKFSHKMSRFFFDKTFIFHSEDVNIACIENKLKIPLFIRLCFSRSFYSIMLCKFFLLISMFFVYPRNSFFLKFRRKIEFNF